MDFLNWFFDDKESKEGTDARPKHQIKDIPKLGWSPVPGVTLGAIFTGHTRSINRIAWSPDGRHLASPSDDKTIRVWSLARGDCVAILQGHTSSVICVTWSPDGKLLASCSADQQILIWDFERQKPIRQLSGHTNQINAVAWAPTGQKLASGSTDGTIWVWDTNTWERLTIFKIDFIKPPIVTDLIWLPGESPTLASAIGHNPSNIIIWDVKNKKQDWGFKISLGFTHRLTLSKNNNFLVSAGEDKVIHIHNIKPGKENLQLLEGHTSSITGISYSYDNQLLASNSDDNTIRIWHTDTFRTINQWKINNKTDNKIFGGLEFHPYQPYLAALGHEDLDIYLWKIDQKLPLQKISANSVRYTTAKIVLVGDSGVGKTGLGWRLAHNEFKEHSSSHGQQFWVIPELKKIRDDDTECEAVLWDLAGQHIYRSIHSIFLDDVDASLVLFDPTNRQEPLKGAQFWLGQLKGKKQLPPSVLVGARLDRGASVLSQQELNQFCHKYGISGGYIGTSAKSGEGLNILFETLKKQIPWDHMTTTVTTITFKRIKEFVLSLKEKPNRKGVLVRPNELRKQLQATDHEWQFTDAEMTTAVGHLANLGYVSILKSSSGEGYVLLIPELLVSVAASIFLHADKHPRELGAIKEAELLQGKYPIEEFKGLEKEEQQVLLDATVVRFLEHSLCFRETLGNDNLLIFPSLIKQKRPLKDDIPATDDISYIVRGRVENIYATLVVLLGYTPSFNRINQWQNQAQYETEAGNICGFRLIEDRESEIELILYYGNNMPMEQRNNFQELFEQFLYQREAEVTSFPPVVCLKGHRQERATVVKRLREGKDSVFCEECGTKTDLPSLEQPQTIGIDASEWLKHEEAVARLRSLYETHLVRVKGYRRGWETPRCYISNIPEQKHFVYNLEHDLNDAGIYVIDDPSKVIASDTVIVLDSPAYQKAWQVRAKSLQKDVDLIQPRLSSKKLVSVVIEGKIMNTHDLRSCRPGNFCDETHYAVSLFDLVLNLYAIPFTHAGFVPLRKSLHELWERDLAGKTGKDMTPLFKVFISYSHKDEEFKDELVTMLASLQRRGVIDAWQDRRIEEGDEWYQDIQDAMNDCKLAILLVSANFLASRFIQDEELPRLLKRRSEEDLRVVPIIVKQCMWQSEPVIKDLQVMPRDGKPVITFSKDNGDRDQAWTDIAKAIEKRAKK